MASAKHLFVVLSTALALAVPAASLGTTLPNKSVIVNVVYFKGRMVVAYYQGETLGNGTPGYQAFVGTIPRGSYLHFKIFNRDKKTHQFTAFGKTTKPIKPGGAAYFNKLAKVRGKFPYKDLKASGKTYRGTFVIA